MTGETRRRPRAARQTGALHQAKFGQVPRLYPPVEVLSADHLEAIHLAALKILSTVGMRVLEPAARDRYRRAGADVKGETVRFDPAMVIERLATVPSQFTLAARNPARSLRLGGAEHVFASVGGPAYVMDNDRGRRDGTFAEMCDFLKLVQQINVIHQEGGGPFEPLDLPANTRHLDIYLAQITLLDKNWQTQTLGRLRTMDGLEMGAMALGLTLDGLAETPALLGIINTNSPLQLDVPMAEGLMTLAEHGQVNVITPFTLAGAMSPVTLAGALVQQHAEAMAGITLTQIVRPGVPVMYGGFTSNVDMRSGAPAFGTPEYTKAAQASGQLARRIGVPFRSSNVCAANEVDAQAAYESQMALWGALMGGAHLVEHAAGWLHGGLTASFEKLILDADMLQMMEAYFQPIAVTPETLAVETIAEVGPGGHFFGTSHTMERYETAFYAPILSNWDNHPQWLEKGGMQARERANLVWKQMLAEYEQPPLDPAIGEALDAFVARRKAEGGAPLN
ncbi:trimethylamine methyltransferase family protein [Tabrizicola sp. J26]|uniref:trimethylamine methyltransferase family protein n=1 Tax=Alitabrizicola rongguiensis TaxID=2909234 RepID=UPI001F2C31E5|nr:trimethylamine methyltransferase family protein [Tabrizicola rongguiensis]MCF1709244.1 trimethylamine methyltransferase family protein [Tabrizicola rongguiensis]